MAKILVLHGPNLNLLGKREPSLYGATDLAAINQELTELAKQQQHELNHFQSNSEASLIDRIHQAADENTAYIIINPAAYTHTSIAIRDALLAVAIPFIEVHLSNVHARENFRHQSYFSDIAQGVICGLGATGYHLALHACMEKLTSQKP